MADCNTGKAGGLDALASALNTPTLALDRSAPDCQENPSAAKSIAWQLASTAFSNSCWPAWRTSHCQQRGGLLLGVEVLVKNVAEGVLIVVQDGVPIQDDVCPLK